MHYKNINNKNSLNNTIINIIIFILWIIIIACVICLLILWSEKNSVSFAILMAACVLSSLFNIYLLSKEKSKI